MEHLNGSALVLVLMLAWAIFKAITNEDKGGV